MENKKTVLKTFFCFLSDISYEIGVNRELINVSIYKNDISTDNCVILNAK